MKRAAAGALFLLAAAFLSCTDAGLEANQGQGPETMDDKLALTGRLCTKVPGDEEFPVKIVFAIDTSYSARVTDPAQQRVTAVNQVLDRFAGNPSVKFDVVAFDAIVTDITGGFTSTPDRAAITARLQQSDRLTDYQGALGTIYANLSKDMVESGPAIRARTKYVIIFFSDGSPDPQCWGGTVCDPAGANQCLIPGNPTAACKQISCQPNGRCGPVFDTVCTVDRRDWPDTFQLPPGTNPNTGGAWTWDDFAGLYPDMEAGRNYNTPEQLVEKVQDIMSLQTIYNVGEVRFHTGFLFDPNIGQAFIDAFCLDRPTATDLMQKMAAAGNGTFTEFTSGASISFLNINYVSIKQLYKMTNFLASNVNAVPSVKGTSVIGTCQVSEGGDYVACTPLGQKPVPQPSRPAVDACKLLVLDDPCRITFAGAMADSDGDHSPDETEDLGGLCASSDGLGCASGVDPVDSDGDGYTDAFELKLKSSGFDPLDPAKPTSTCASGAADMDGDGLRDCEEAVVGTNPRLFDSDGDRFPDGVELYSGTDPLDPDDITQDADADGLRNGDEILFHWDPLTKEPPQDQPARYWYQVLSLGETPDGRSCYDYDIRDIQLTVTRGPDDDTRGMNRVMVYFVEGPPDDPRDFGSMRTACVHGRYTSQFLKTPADGKVALCEAQFKAAGDPSLTCVAGRGAPCGSPPKDQCGAGLICQIIDCTTLVDVNACQKHGCSWSPGTAGTPCVGATTDGVCVDGCDPAAPCCPGGETCRIWKTDQPPTCGCDPLRPVQELAPEERCPETQACVPSVLDAPEEGRCRKVASG